MKKQSRRRVLALLSALALLSTLAIVSLPTVSAADGWSGNPGLSGNAEDGYTLVCNNYAGNVTYTGADLDMTYGVSFSIDEQTDWLWATAKDADGNEVSNLFWRNSNGKIRGGVGPEARHTDGVLDTIGTHTLTIKTEDGGRYWYFDDQKINVAITNTAAITTFRIGTNGSGRYKLSGLKINEAPAWTFVAGNAEPTITGDETDGYCISGAGNYTATYQKAVNMETGITFSLNDSAGWINLSFAGEGRTEGIYLKNQDGWLMVTNANDSVILGSYNGGGMATEMKIPFVGTHTISWRAGSDSPDAFRWRIDGVKLFNGGTAVSNTNPLAAAKVSIISQKGLKISCFKAFQPAWKISGGSFTKDVTGAYTISGDANFLWNEKVDIAKGFEFQLDKIGAWIQVTLRADTDGFNNKPLAGGINLMLKNIDGKLYASYFSSSNQEVAQTPTSIDSAGVHTLKMEKGGDNYYRWVIDTTTVCGAAANSASDVDTLNNNGKGTYIQIGTWGAAALSHIRPAATGETVIAAVDGITVDLPEATDGEMVTVTVKAPIGSSLKAGSLKVVDENGTALAIPARVGFRENDDETVYTFPKPEGDRVFVTAEYVNSNATEPNQGLAGWSINEEKSGLRSVYRMYLSEKDGSFIYRNGNKSIDSFGILLCSENTYAAAGDLTCELAKTTAKMLDTNFAEKQIFWDTCGAYVDISVSVINIKEAQKSTKLYTRGYVVVDGQAYYTDVVCRSYAEMAS